MNDKLPNNDQSQLREQMWELVYGLLDQDQSQELITRIKSDPQAARLYAEVRLQADLVGYASKVEDSSLVLTGDAASRETAPAAGRSAAAAIAAEKPQAAGRSRSGNFLAGIVAAALALLIGIGIFWPEASDRELALKFPVIDIHAQRELTGGITGEVDVKVARLDGVGQPAEVEALVVDADGRETWAVRKLTNDVGVANLQIPGEALAPGAKLKVAAAPVQQVRKELRELTDADKQQPDDQRWIEQVEAKLEAPATSLTAELPVREEPQMKYYFFAKPPQPGEENEFAMWNLLAFSATPVPAEVSAAAVEDQAGATLAEPTRRSADGFLYGYMSVPESAEPTELQLALRDEKGDKRRARLDGVVLQQENESRASSLRNGRFDLAAGVRSGAAGGAVPGLESAFAPASAPAAPSPPGASPAVAAKPGESLAQAQREAQAERAPATGDEPPAQQPAPAVVTLKQENNVVQETEVLAELSKTVAETASGKGITVQLPAELAGRSLTAKVLNRGLEVAQKSIDAYELPAKDVADLPADGQPSDTAGQSVTFHLPPEVSGPVTIGLYDSETNELLEEQVVLRESTRKLNVSVVDGRESYPPGETISLTLQFTDENGQPAPGAWCGVRVWNEDVVENYGRRPLLLADAMQRMDTDELHDGKLALDRAKTIDSLATTRTLESFHRARITPESKAAEEKSAIAALDAIKADEAPSPRAEEPQPATPAPAAPSTESLTEADALPRVAAAPDASAAGSGAAEFGAQAAAGEGLQPLYAETAGEGRERWVETRLGDAWEQTTLASNIDAVRAEYDAAKQQAASQRQTARATIGRVLLFGGIGALVVLGLVVLLKLPAKARVVVPSLAVGIASVVLGLSWMGMRPGANSTQIAMVEDRADFDRAAATPSPTTMPAAAGPAPVGQALDDSMVDADRSAPGALGGRGYAAGGQGAGGGPSSSHNFAFRRDGAESQNAPRLAPSEFSDRENLRSQAGAEAFGLPAGGAAKGPAGRGGADIQRGGEAERSRFSRFKEQAEGGLSLKQEGERGEAAPRKSAGDETREGEKPAAEAADDRGDSPTPAPKYSKTTPSATRNVVPGGAPPAEPPPAPAEATPAPAPATAAAPANRPAPSRPLAAAAPLAEDKKDGERESGGKAKKEAARDKAADQPAAPGASEGDENRVKTDPKALANLPSPLTDNLRTGEAGFGGGGSGAPAAIYFNPRLIADENGRATIEFTLPPVESEYRLLIDALGRGRIGSLQQRIEIKAAK
jgi:hypothetical protein